MHTEKKQPADTGTSRRNFFKTSAVLTAAAVIPSALETAANNRVDEKLAYKLEGEQIEIEVNGKKYTRTVDTRTSLLDFLREDLHLTGTKKGCDLGQCGACIVHIDGKRMNACLTLAVDNNGKKVTTIEGLANGDELHPMQAAFIKHDGFQCGYCTPGQIMSAVACVNEGQAGSEDSIKEYMNGNICRCGAYNGIVKAIKEVAAKK